MSVLACTPSGVESNENEDLCLWAHSENEKGDMHGLVEHLRAVAALAAEFAGVFGAASLAWWLGMVHDLGKAAEGWQERLLALCGTRGSVGIDHKAAGARFAVERLGLWRFAMAVQGHHGGLESPVLLHGFLTSPDRDRSAEEQSIGRLSALVPELRDPTPPQWPAWARSDPLAGEMLLRMVFSALVDADYLDTQAHFRPGEASATMSVGMRELLSRYEDARGKQLANRPASAMDGFRSQVYDDCLRAAELPPGFFRLAAPTGVGKTIAAGGFALHHAVRHGMRRVVVAVPFLSVTDQNAKVYRDWLDADGSSRVVLEHHTAVNVESGPGGRWQRLAAENWDAEFIVTTTVQLFESLHSRTPSRMRKLHRLARSVIVLDEVQAIPVHVLEPVLLALRQLVEHFGVTVLLASATQPEFWHLPVVDGIEPVPVVSEPERLYDTLKRVRYRWWTTPKPTLAEVAAEAAVRSRALVVVNTTDHARAVLTGWQASTSSADVRHLSTRMCSRHRLDTLDEIRALLAGPGDVLVVSTQLVEAGVDLDFPVVYRAIAPAESMLQAAGRCNREGCLGHAGGLVVLFDPVEIGCPPSYAVPLHETRKAFGPSAGKAELDDLNAFATYSAAVYSSLNPTERGQAVVDARREWDCPRVTDLFRMIDDQSVPVLVDYRPTGDQQARDRADRVVAAIRRGRTPRPHELRHLQPFLASMPRTRALRDDRAVPLIGDLHVWNGRYDPHHGIDLDPKEH
ncbi:CRISPR-associated Cas3 family helicase [Lentzea atacamensis]|uniref:CRISPR-associated Cas3 family helicase n=1 Tax=Lentzea atacamensis TaxID=531938 RepID=A0ABX9DWE1_9PSEU|nr:CRISPR-associated Cas3 family helicase [Lentzea atacamensis]